MSDALRRSTRRNNGHRKRDGYSAGDVIELTRAGGFAHGRLVNQRSADDPASPWLVTFDDQDFPDEEIHEDDLGPVVARVDDSDNGSSKNGDATKSNKGSKKNSLRSKPALSANRDDAKAGSGSDDAESLDSSNKKKRRSSSIDLQPDDHASNVDTDASSPTDAAKLAKLVSDREQRSRRRQQIIEEDVVPGSDLLKIGHPKPTTNNGLALPLAKKAKTQGGEAVVKIPMLTGTLYLYRGAKRRVAFVRKL